MVRKSLITIRLGDITCCVGKKKSPQREDKNDGGGTAADTTTCFARWFGWVIKRKESVHNLPAE